MSANPQQSTALAIWTPQTLQAALEDPRQQLPALLEGTGMRPGKFIVSVNTECQRLPKLYECGMSVVHSAVVIAQMGLEIGGRFGEAFIIPYRQRGSMIAQPQIGYPGWIHLAMASRLVKKIAAHAVRERDFFEYDLAAEKPFTFKPKLDGPRGEIITFFGYAATVAGGVIPAVRSRAEVEAHRDKYSKAYQQAIADGRKDTPWITSFEAMGCKTLILEVKSQLPKGAVKNEAWAIAETFDAADEDGHGVDPEAFVRKPGTKGGRSTRDDTISVPYTEVRDEPAAQRSDGSAVNRGTGEVTNFMRPWPGQMTSQLRQEIVEAGAAVGLDRDALDDLCHGLDLPGDPSDYDESHYEKLSRALAAKRSPKKPGW